MYKQLVKSKCKQKEGIGKWKKVDGGGMESDSHIHVFGLLKHYIHRQHIPHSLRLLPTAVEIS